MFYEEYKPAGALSRYIKCFWSLEHDYSSEPFKDGERIWPDGHFELIFSNGERYFQKTETGFKELPKNFLIGQFNREIILLSKGITRLTAVRFQAWGLYPFLNTTMSRFTNEITDASSLSNGMFEKVAADLWSESVNNRIRVLESSLAKHATSVAENPVESVAAEIVDKKGVVTIGELTETHQINIRKLQRQFEIVVGLSAKQFAKIIRFNYAKKLIQMDARVNLAEVAYECGYSDQAHFIKNFKSLYGITPTQFKEKILQFQAQL